MAGIDYLPAYGSFSGVDMVISMAFPGYIPVVVGEATTITYSVLRDTGEVRTLGRITPRAFTKGGRKIAGQIVFTVFNKHLVNHLKEKVPYLKNLDRLLIDELPPFDLIISMGNEYGNKAKMAIYGVCIIHDGKTISVEDMFTENIMAYWAKDIMPLTDSFEYLNSNYASTTEATPRFKIDELTTGKDLAEWQRDVLDLQLKYS